MGNYYPQWKWDYKAYLVSVDTAGFTDLNAVKQPELSKVLSIYKNYYNANGKGIYCRLDDVTTLTDIALAADKKSFEESYSPSSINWSYKALHATNILQKAVSCKQHECDITVSKQYILDAVEQTQSDFLAHRLMSITKQMPRRYSVLQV